MPLNAILFRTCGLQPPSQEGADEEGRDEEPSEPRECDHAVLPVVGWVDGEGWEWRCGVDRGSPMTRLRREPLPTLPNPSPPLAAALRRLLRVRRRSARLAGGR